MWVSLSINWRHKNLETSHDSAHWNYPAMRSAIQAAAIPVMLVLTNTTSHGVRRPLPSHLTPTHVRFLSAYSVRASRRIAVRITPCGKRLSDRFSTLCWMTPPACSETWGSKIVANWMSISMACVASNSALHRPIALVKFPTQRCPRPTEFRPLWPNTLISCMTF